MQHFGFLFRTTKRFHWTYEPSRISLPDSKQNPKRVWEGIGDLPWGNAKFVKHLKNYPKLQFLSVMIVRNAMIWIKPQKQLKFISYMLYRDSTNTNDNNTHARVRVWGRLVWKNPAQNVSQCFGRQPKRVSGLVESAGSGGRFNTLPNLNSYHPLRNGWSDKPRPMACSHQKYPEKRWQLTTHQLRRRYLQRQ